MSRLTKQGVPSSSFESGSAHTAGTDDVRYNTVVLLANQLFSLESCEYQQVKAILFSEMSMCLYPPAKKIAVPFWKSVTASIASLHPTCIMIITQ